MVNEQLAALQGEHKQLEADLAAAKRGDAGYVLSNLQRQRLVKRIEVIRDRIAKLEGGGPR